VGKEVESLDKFASSAMETAAYVLAIFGAERVLEWTYAATVSYREIAIRSNWHMAFVPTNSSSENHSLSLCVINYLFM
jgi:hypothetical protein